MITLDISSRIDDPSYTSPTFRLLIFRPDQQSDNRSIQEYRTLAAETGSQPSVRVVLIVMHDPGHRDDLAALFKPDQSHALRRPADFANG